MANAGWERVKELLHRALQLSAEERGRFLDQVCGADAALRTEVESMLAAKLQMDPGFLESSPIAGALRQHSLLDLPADLATGELFAERFVLVRKLGEGGMGQVWLGEQTSPVRRLVALKLIRAGMYDASVARRFLAERQSLAIMEHPAIAKVFDAGTTPQGQPYFVMEYVPGVSITEYCDAHRLKIKDRLELLIQACDGVQHAHQKAIIHRDLKPANILVVEIDGKAVPRIIDFGLAKSVTSSVTDQTLYTHFGQVMGTPGYMSPEQLDPNAPDIDTRTDVYSLGVILYVLLTGVLPFERKQRQKAPLDELLRRIREEEPARPSSKLTEDRDTAVVSARARGTERKELVSLLRGDLDWIAMKALARDRTLRYGTPSELAADLKRYLNHEPVSARSRSTAYQLRKYIRRHRVAAAALSAVVCALAVGMALALWQAHAAREAAREARAQEQRARHLGALSAERAGDAASQLGLVNSAVAYLASAIRLDPDNPALRSELLLQLEEQGHWWLPVGLPMRHAQVKVVTFSPDNRRIVTASLDGSAKLWDPIAGRQLGATMHHAAEILSVRFSRDGAKVLTASKDGTARVWDAATGQPLGPPLEHGSDANDGDFSAAGDRVVTVSDDRSAKLWDYRTGRVLAVMPHDGMVHEPHFNPDGTRIVTTSGNAAYRWDAATGRSLAPALRHRDQVLDAEWSPDGRRIVTASEDKTARIWDAVTGHPIGPPLRHDSEITRAYFSRDGAEIITLSSDRTARLWDGATGEPLTEPLHHIDPPTSARFSADGLRVLTASSDGTVRVWDVHSRESVGAPVKLWLEFVASAQSGDGARLVNASVDGTVQVWEERSTRADALRYEPSASLAYFDRDGQRLLANDADHDFRLWDVRTGAPLAPLMHLDAEASEVGFSSDGALLMTVTDRTVRVWDAKTGAALGMPMRHERPVSAASFTPDGATVLTSSKDGALRLWEARTGLPRGEPHRLETGGFGFDMTPDGSALLTLSASGVQVWDLSRFNKLGEMPFGPTWRYHGLSPDGTRLLVSTRDGTAHLYAVPTGAELAKLVHTGQVYRAHFSPDGTRIATASDDNTARLWDGHTGSPLGRVMAHGAAVERVNFSPDGTRIVTGSLDQTARLWDARTGAPIGAPMRHDGIVRSANFSPDGSRIVTGSADRTARVWDGWTGQPLTGPMRHDWPLYWAIFSPDGTHVLTHSFSGPFGAGRAHLRLWPVLSAGGGRDALRLADLAEAVGGFRVDAMDGIVPVENRLASLRALLGSRSTVAPAGDIDRLIGELAAPPDVPVGTRSARENAH